MPLSRFSAKAISVVLLILSTAIVSAAQTKGIDSSLLAKAKAGDADAEFQIAIIYAKLGNLKESHYWHLTAARNGNVRSMTIIAADYEFARGVKRDDGQAFSWYHKAADAGYWVAMENMGDLYFRGVGVPQDFTQAAIWYRKAAEQGDALAQSALGGLYINGIGVPQDYAEAYFWLDLAAAGNLTGLNSEDTAKSRDLAASHLNSAVLLQTQERARKWFEDHPVKLLRLQGDGLYPVLGVDHR